MTALPAHGLPVFWIDGERKPNAEAHVSAADLGLTLADGVFETMRAYGGVVFRLDRHLARLERALATLEIPLPHRVRDQVIGAARVARDGVVRLVVTRGVGAGGVAVQAGARPTMIVVAA